MFRIYFLAIEVYKCMKGLNPPYLNELFKQREMHYPLRNSDILKQSKFNTFTFGYKSFAYYGAKVWNTLNPCIKQSENLNSFKRELKNWCLGSEACKIIDF